MNKKLKITYMPGAFDSFEGTQEELDALIKEIERGVESGEILENSRPVDLESMAEEDPELAQILTEMFEKLESEDVETHKRKLN